MAEKRLIDANAFKQFLESVRQDYIEENTFSSDFAADVIETVQDEYLELVPTVDAVKLPCKIGDWVWAIRSYHGKKHPQRGIVSDMYFANDMSLIIVVKHIARGKWGETVFATDKDAYAAIGERKDND